MTTNGKSPKAPGDRQTDMSPKELRTSGIIRIRVSVGSSDDIHGNTINTMTTLEWHAFKMTT